MTQDLFEIQIKVLGLGYNDRLVLPSCIVVLCLSNFPDIVSDATSSLCLCKVENGNPNLLKKKEKKKKL